MIHSYISLSFLQIPSKSIHCMPNQLFQMWNARLFKPYQDAILSLSTSKYCHINGDSLQFLDAQHIHLHSRARIGRFLSISHGYTDAYLPWLALLRNSGGSIHYEIGNKKKLDKYTKLAPNTISLSLSLTYWTKVIGMSRNRMRSHTQEWPPMYPSSEHQSFVHIAMQIGVLDHILLQI